MKKAKTVGLVYIHDPGWTGGTDYVLNLLNALSYLPQEQFPKIKLFIDETVNSTSLKSKIIYPEFEIIQIKSAQSYIQKLLAKLDIFGKRKLDILYPFPKSAFFQNYFSEVSDSAKFYWIPDFQEEYFPQFFADSELQKRRKLRNQILQRPENKVVFSSEAALSDALKFYPNSKAKTFVLHFANPIGLNFNKENAKSILSKYGVKEGEYFISPNQFWRHKNHDIIISTIHILKSQGITKKVLFTGREQDSRDLDFFPDLKRRVTSMGLQEDILFLGFLPKEDLYALIAFAKAMIQPSLFEGWSTTIEDGIALNVPIICSNLEVNKEQLGNAAVFFDPNDPYDLIRCLTNDEYIKRPDFDLKKRISVFAQSFINLI